jgi:uncharacterized protein
MHDYVISFVGGICLGIAVVGYLYVHGRIAGISGLLSQMLQPQAWFTSSAFWFLLGLVLTPFIYSLFHQPKIDIQASPWMMVVAGILVGFGTRLGSGCTSGHGICGLSRLSKRSMIATLTFMLAGIMTVYVIRHIWGDLSI